MPDEIIVVSAPYLPGYRITKTIGFTWGLIVRSRGLGRNITAGLRSLAGGEIHEYTELAKNGSWVRNEVLTVLAYPIRELSGRTFGIVGWGEFKPIGIVGNDRDCKKRDVSVQPGAG